MHPWKTAFFTLVLGCGFATAGAQADSTGLPGDQFNLRGALELFKKASSPEQYEKLLNESDNHVNNLDLDGDGQTDYIRVIDKAEKDLHAIILQVPVSETEAQDIAVIEIEKTGAESAMLQIVGDEDIFGEQLIYEPSGEEGDNALLSGWNSGNTSGPSAIIQADDRIIVNVWFWPSVRFIYGPVYRPWISPWRWRHYPIWWKPWKPLGWGAWRPYRMHPHRHVVLVHTHRVGRVHQVYVPFRTRSVTVRTKHATAHNNYRITRTKTTVSGPRGRSATRTTTTVSGKNGKVKAKKTNVRRGRH